MGIRHACVELDSCLGCAHRNLDTRKHSQRDKVPTSFHARHDGEKLALVCVQVRIRLATLAGRDLLNLDTQFA